VHSYSCRYYYVSPKLLLFSSVFLSFYQSLLPWHATKMIIRHNVNFYTSDWTTWEFSINYWSNCIVVTKEYIYSHIPRRYSGMAAWMVWIRKLKLRYVVNQVLVRSCNSSRSKVKSIWIPDKARMNLYSQTMWRPPSTK